MTDRPGWMPNFMVVLEIQDGNYEDGEIDRAFRLTGIRAQIAVMEEINPHTEQIYNKLAALREELAK